VSCCVDIRISTYSEDVVVPTTATLEKLREFANDDDP